MRIVLSCLVGFCAACLTAPGFADDSSAALGAGGLVLTHSQDIRMASEDLYVSPKQVQVRFVFVSDSPHDIDSVVAFVLPDIDTYKFWGEAIGTTTFDPVNFVGFEVLENGKPVPVQAEQRAIYAGRDVTDIIKAAGAPLNTIVDGGPKAMEHLSTRAISVLQHGGLVERDGTDTIAKWLLRTKFYWTQNFPAGKEVVLEQRYQPVTGQSFFSRMELKGGEDAAYWQKNYCLDDSTRSAIAAKLQQSLHANPQNEGGLLNAFTTDYILTTGNNWKGPIGRFHLTLDKLRPDNVVSICWDGALRRTSPTTFESDAQNLAPARDIHLLVLTGTPPPQ